MDEKGSNQTPKALECDYCKKKFDPSRKDNFKKHVQEVCLKILPSCKTCGKKMTSGALTRHRRNCEKKHPYIRAESVDSTKQELMPTQIIPPCAPTENESAIIENDLGVVGL